MTAVRSSAESKYVMQAPLTIIGTGMAGIGLVRQVRALDARRPITLITADSGDDYSKPLLSTGFAKGLAADRLAAVRPWSWPIS